MVVDDKTLAWARGSGDPQRVERLASHVCGHEAAGVPAASRDSAGFPGACAQATRVSPDALSGPGEAAPPVEFVKVREAVGWLEAGMEEAPTGTLTAKMAALLALGAVDRAPSPTVTIGCPGVLLTLKRDETGSGLAGVGARAP